VARNMLGNVGLFFVEDTSLNFEDFSHLSLLLPSLFVFQVPPTGVNKLHEDNLVIRDFASNSLY